MFYEHQAIGGYCNTGFFNILINNNVLDMQTCDAEATLLSLEL